MKYKICLTFYSNASTQIIKVTSPIAWEKIHVLSSNILKVANSRSIRDYITLADDFGKAIRWVLDEVDGMQLLKIEPYCI